MATIGSARPSIVHGRAPVFPFGASATGRREATEPGPGAPYVRGFLTTLPFPFHSERGKLALCCLHRVGPTRLATALGSSFETGAEDRLPPDAMGARRTMTALLCSDSVGPWTRGGRNGRRTCRWRIPPFTGHPGDAVARDHLDPSRPGPLRPAPCGSWGLAIVRAPGRDAFARVRSDVGRRRGHCRNAPVPSRAEGHRRDRRRGRPEPSSSRLREQHNSRRRSPVAVLG